jgi:hypothetical protein
MSRVPAQQIGKAELMEQTDAALLRSELLLEEMLNSGLFDADVHVSQASPEAEVSAADNQYGNGFVDSPADWAASKTVEVPVTMLQTLAKMWDELQSHREAEKHSELSVASTRCPSPSASSVSLPSLPSNQFTSSVSVRSWPSPVSTLMLEKREFIKELRQLFRDTLRQESLSEPKQVCQATRVHVPVDPGLVRVERRFVWKPLTATRVRRGFLI